MHPLNGTKRGLAQSEGAAPPTKRQKSLLPDDDNLEHNGLAPTSNNGAVTTDAGFDLTINAEFARKFEHNKKREELHRLQEKFGHPKATKQANGNVNDSVSEESSESEDEDDNGVLVSAAVDAQIRETLDAIRRKDPRVYDKNAAFFSESSLVDEGLPADTASQAPRPIYLDQYHRQNLVRNASAQDANPEPYKQQQETLKADVRHEISMAALPRVVSDEDDFLTKKAVPPAPLEQGESLSPLDIDRADEDPDAYLSTFMATRGWVPHGKADLIPFESDDEEDERKAEEFEAAYNLRFEDPQKSNEKLVSHARDIVAQHSVRKDQLNSRKRARIIERERKDIERQNRQDERRRLKKLKQDELAEKVQKIKEVAGFRGEKLSEEEWASFLAETWDNDQWEEQMQKRFDQAYYAQGEEAHADGKTSTKPTWDEEIDIKDIIPDFVDEGMEAFKTEDISSASDHESQGDRESHKKPKSPEGLRRTMQNEKRESRRERQAIETMVDEKLEVDNILADFGKRHQGNFRYRDTSPVAFGMTPEDILNASDSQLNQFAGLKKLATFRDPEKKRKDRKRLGKKGRLRDWRKEAFENNGVEDKTVRPHRKTGKQSAR